MASVCGIGLRVQFALCALITLVCEHSAADTQTRFSQVRRLSAQQYGNGYNIQSEYLSTAKPASTHRPLFYWDTGILKPEDSLQLEPSHVRMNTFDTDNKKIDVNKIHRKNKKKNIKHLKEKNNVWWPWKSYSEWLASHRANQMNNTSVAIQEKESDEKLNFKRAKQEVKAKRKRNRAKKKRRKMQGKTKRYRLSHEKVEGQTTEKRKESLSTMIGNNFDVAILEQTHIVNRGRNGEMMDKNRNNAHSTPQVTNILPKNSNQTLDSIASEVGKVDHNINEKSVISDFKHDDMDEHILSTKYYSTLEQEVGATVLTAIEATETTPSKIYGKKYIDSKRYFHNTFEGPEVIKVEEKIPLHSIYVLGNATALSKSNYTNQSNSVTNISALSGTMDDFIHDPERTNLIQPIVNLNPFSKNAQHAVFNRARINYTQDLNECVVDNGGCEGLCINTRGSYHCHCPAGFRLANNNKQCLDINECLLRNGHGPCEGECINRWGSYECRCQESTRLAADGHSCQHIDQCAQGDCSHHCISTRAGPFCVCPDGYVLGYDWKTCQDVDECKMPDMQSEPCLNGCVNTVGSFYCL